MPDTIEALRRRPDVDNNDIDDIIGIAAELQDHDQRQAEGASLDDVERVAAELDIDPSYVEKAIAELHRRRTQARQDEAAAQVATAERRGQLRRLAGYVASGLIGLLLLGGGGVLTAGALGSSNLNQAHARLDAAESTLEVVLDRQASLAPQLMALSGSDDAEVTAAARALRAATDIDGKIAASQDLDAALSRALARLPAAPEGTAAQQRLDLQHEVVGLTNRITIEHRRMQEARADAQAAALTVTGRAARWTGLSR